MSDVMLSIYVATYNHENYIEQALDSILMQETEYSYEVLVGEDCSKDNTRAILKEYEKKHPGRLTIFYREKNMYNQWPNNGLDLKNRCKGKYIIALEGDDYWTDPKKIDKQIRFLETHPEYVAVAHKCTVVDKNSMPKNENYPACCDDEYTFRHYASEIMPGQLTTLMYRNPNTVQVDTTLVTSRFRPGDRALFFWLLLNGKVRCLPDNMSAYRHVSDSGTSFSATYSYVFEEHDDLYYNLLQYARKSKNEEAIKYAEFLYVRTLLYGLRLKQCSWKGYRERLGRVNKRMQAFGLYFKYRFNKHILHKQVWF